MILKSAQYIRWDGRHPSTTRFNLYNVRPKHFHCVSVYDSKHSNRFLPNIRQSNNSAFQVGSHTAEDHGLCWPSIGSFFLGRHLSIFLSPKFLPFWVVSARHVDIDLVLWWHTLCKCERKPQVSVPVMSNSVSVKSFSFPYKGLLLELHIS